MTKTSHKQVRRPRAGSEGFKLIEVLVAMAVLMIASMGILRLHGTIIKGIAASEDFSVALDVAGQRLEDLVMVGAENLPVCPVPGPGPGCRATMTAFQPELGASTNGYACTRYVDSPELLMANGAFVPQGTADNSRYRVDTSIEGHPDTTLFPEGRLVTVSVCWLDPANQIRQVQARRYVVPGV